ncbi:hypothetical protein SDC9_92124 [bioreactor metagenome]|uniref:Uncharacterized protein n=1 Tax=bioreactor metagenome TaxID=1076179 RepID=A0A644ZXF8_9ZZZZ
MTGGVRVAGSWNRRGEGAGGMVVRGLAAEPCGHGRDADAVEDGRGNDEARRAHGPTTVCSDGVSVCGGVCGGACDGAGDPGRDPGPDVDRAGPDEDREVGTDTGRARPGIGDCDRGRGRTAHGAGRSSRLRLQARRRLWVTARLYSGWPGGSTHGDRPRTLFHRAVYHRSLGHSTGLCITAQSVIPLGRSTHH